MSQTAPLAVGPKSASDVDPSLTPSPATLSAEEIHGYLLKTYRISNRLRREFLKALLSLSEGKLYLKLGFSSIAQYNS